jgi:pyridoxamine 5'-phosphate oxidase
LVTDRDLSELRREYAERGLDEADLIPDPIQLFGRWLDDALEAGLHEPNAMVLTTVSAAGAPASRIVLLKALRHGAFVFFTNYDSRKGTELDANAACALLFPWHPLERQVRVEGRAQRLPASESDAYFATRPRPSQLGAWASPQSEVVPDRAALERRYEQVSARFGGGPVPRPESWGGFAVTPDSMELWQGRTGRMHDRLRYRRTTDGWTTERLAP